MLNEAKVFLTRIALLACIHICLSAEARPWLLLFGSEGCEQCEEIRALWSERGGDAVLVYMSIDKEQNYRFLAQLEKALEIRRPGNAFPVVFAGHKLVNGLDGFYKLAPELDELLGEKQELALFEGIASAVDASQENIISWDAPGEMPEQEGVNATNGSQMPSEAKKKTWAVVFSLGGILFFALFFVVFLRLKRRYAKKIQKKQNFNLQSYKSPLN